MMRTFRHSPPTVGVELEWQLVDVSTLDQCDRIVPLLELVKGEPRIKPELHQTAVETITTPRGSTAELRDELVDVVSRLVDAAARLGVALIGSGTHAFCDRLIPVTPLPRYVSIAHHEGYLARALVAYSLQTHVGMPSGNVAIRVMRGLRGVLPVLLALSASSPFVHGCETAFASYRHRLLASTRSYGLPPLFEDWEEFVRFLDTVERASMFGSFRDMHWDARLRPDLGTIEVRIMDAQPTLARSLALSALVHSLLVHLAHLATSRASDAIFLQVLPWWIEKENAYRASLDGVEASLICDTDGNVRPLRGLAEDLLALVAPTARDLGEEEDLARVRAMLTDGPCYRKQLDVFRRSGSTKDVVRALANELLGELGRERIDERTCGIA